MNAGFTPGPWQWVGDDEIEQTEHPFTSVAEVVRIHRDAERGQQNANARLIAAAPDLYDALEELAEWADRYVDYVDVDPLLGAARTALAKARGEQVQS